MTTIYSLYSSLLVVSSVLSGLLLILLIKYRANKTARALATLAFASLGINISVLLATYSPSPESAVFWHGNIRLILNSFIPPTGFFFVYTFLGGRNQKVTWLVFSVPILTIFISLTNSWHHLLFGAYVMQLGGYYLRTSWQPGGWFFVISIQSYVIAFGLLYLLFAQVGKSIKLPRWRGLLIVNVVAIITGAMTLDTLGYYIAPGLLSVPIGLGFMNLTLVIGIWYIDLFDVLPIVRETLVRYMPDGVFVVDTNDIILDVNPAAIQIIDQPVSEILGKNIIQFILREDRTKQTAQILESEFHGVIPLEIQGRDRFFDILVTNIYIENRILVAKLIVLRDVTELNQLQEQDRRRVALEERQRLSRDLHDAVSQTLFSARVTSEMLLLQKKTISSKALWKNINHFAGLVKSALGEMRILLLELRPESLVNAELPILLSHLVDAASSRIDAKIVLDVHGKYELPVDVKIAFYRIAQESLNNIIKHAGSTKVNIQLITDPVQVKLVIGDNGIGLGIGESQGSQLGLSIMRERANEVGAGLEITSQPNLGTQVTCIWKAHGS